MADAYMANTELGATKAVLISSLVQRELAFSAMLRGTVTDVSQFAVPGVKQISFPKLTSFSVSNRTEGVLGETTAVTASVDTMDLNFNAYVSYAIDSMTAKQATIDSQMAALKLAAAAQGRYVDEQIIVKLAAISASFINVGADVDVTYANLLTMRKAILKADGILANTQIICSPAQEAVIMGLAEFKSADAYGGNAVVPNGVVGKILGMPVYVHNGLADKQLFMYEKSALAIGFQKEAEYGEESFLQLGVGAKRIAVDQLFGLVGQQLALKGAAAGKSPLVVGLND
jgi:Phage capsid protein